MTGPQIIMTQGTYLRKTAYQIDPLLNAAVVIDHIHHPRSNEDPYSTDVGEHRSNFHGERFWKPTNKE